MTVRVPYLVPVVSMMPMEMNSVTVTRNDIVVVRVYFAVVMSFGLFLFV